MRNVDKNVQNVQAKFANKTRLNLTFVLFKFWFECNISVLKSK